LVTGTVRDLVAGSGLAFEARGVHSGSLDTDPWPLLAVAR
jgi:hypothetical protein